MYFLLIIITLLFSSSHVVGLPASEKIPPFPLTLPLDTKSPLDLKLPFLQPKDLSCNRICAPHFSDLECGQGSFKHWSGVSVPCLIIDEGGLGEGYNADGWLRPVGVAVNLLRMRRWWMMMGTVRWRDWRREMRTESGCAKVS
jgi:hypothetical protein